MPLHGALGARAVRRDRRRTEDGAVAVEFAIILPILAMLLMGIVTGGVSYAHSVGLANAVREGARFGATADATQSTWLADTQTRVRQTQFDDKSAAADSSTSVCVQLIRTGNVVVKGDCSIGGNGGPNITMPALDQAPKMPTLTTGCAIRVYAVRGYTVNFVLGSKTGTLKSGAVARYEQATC
ncbi:MAG: pilus assembly protein [Nocardioidaceae bacterium]|nr:pilus assembly protein [Nocardioidaceae bacterium]NUS52905.1 pilus assembly protein [Nocardioidaceae bacterium]